MAVAAAVSVWRARVGVSQCPIPIRINKPLSIPMRMRIRLGYSGAVAAVKAKREDEDEDEDEDDEDDDDVVYVGKVVAGSLLAGAAIKYGSALFPQITTPNLLLSLFFILTPLLVALSLFIYLSRTNS